jgi:hypothetical protein
MGRRELIQNEIHLQNAGQYKFHLIEINFCVIKHKKKKRVFREQSIYLQITRKSTGVI